MQHLKEKYDVFYKNRKEQLEYWKLPEDNYEIPHDWMVWAKIDPLWHSFTCDRSVIFTITDPDHEFDVEVEKFYMLHRQIGQYTRKQDPMASISQMKEIVSKVDELKACITKTEKVLEDEIQIQNKNYAKWFSNLIYAFTEHPNIDSIDFIGCSSSHTQHVDANTTFENCHLSTKIAIRNTAAYLYCYDRTLITEAFLKWFTPSKGTYLFLLHAYMKANKQAILDDKTAPIHRIRIKCDGDHISAIVGDLVSIKKSISKFHEKEAKKEAKKQKMNDK